MSDSNSSFKDNARLRYECVIRRRHRMTTAIAACGAMTWDTDRKGYVFAWPVPVDYQPNPVLVVEVDVFDDEERVGSARTMRWISGGETLPIVFPGDDHDGDAATESDDPKPPGLALDFDPDELLREPILVGAR